MHQKHNFFFDYSSWMPRSTTNGPQTFLLDGFQFIVVAAQDTVYAYTLNR